MNGKTLKFVRSKMSKNHKKDNYRLSLPLRSQNERSYVDELGNFLESSQLSEVEKIMNFSKHRLRKNKLRTTLDGPGRARKRNIRSG